MQHLTEKQQKAIEKAIKKWIVTRRVFEWVAEEGGGIVGGGGGKRHPPSYLLLSQHPQAFAEQKKSTCDPQAMCGQSVLHSRPRE